MKWLFRSWRKFITVDISKRFHTIVLVALLVTGGCATAVPHFWPPASGTPTKKIFISLDTWHAMIGFPQERQQDHQEITKPSEFSIQSSRQATFEEWGYAERAWYLEGQHGVSGIIRAMARHRKESSKSRSMTSSGPTVHPNLPQTSSHSASVRKDIKNFATISVPRWRQLLLWPD